MKIYSNMVEITPFFRFCGTVSVHKLLLTTGTGYPKTKLRK